MSRTLQKLTSRQVATLKEPGRYSDGGGLYLSITKPAKGDGVLKKWVFIFTRDGKKREMGLGAVDVSLADARQSAEAARRSLNAGVAMPLTAVMLSPCCSPALWAALPSMVW